MDRSKQIGFWLLMIFGLFLLLMLLIGQTGALINYKLMVSLGLQESEKTIGALGVAINKGFAVSDTLIYLPLLIIGLIGLWRRKSWGIFAMAGALGITAYWPIVALAFLFFAKSVPGFGFTSYTLYIVLLLPITIFSLCGLIYLYKNKHSLVEM